MPSRRHFLSGSLAASAGLGLSAATNASESPTDSGSVVGKHEVVVVGSGAIGSTIAYYLAEEKVKVALVDKGLVGQEGSWATASMLGPFASPGRDPWVVQATTLSHKLYTELNKRLHEETGRWIGFGGDGQMTIARAEGEVDSAKSTAEYQTSLGVRVDWLTGKEAREREPSLPEDVVGASLNPAGRFLDGREYTSVVAEAAGLKGAKIYEGWPVTGMVWQEDRVIGVRSGTDVLLADIVINSAGAWAGRLDPKLTHPVFPLHGQAMSVQEPPTKLRHNLYRVGGHGYITPRADGRVVVGATGDQWGYQKKITAEGITYLGQIIPYVLPCLEGLPVLDIWSGFRPGSPDGLATIGPAPRAAGGGYLWAAGHSSNGMNQAPATAKVLTDLVLQREPRIPIEKNTIERYQL